MVLTQRKNIPASMDPMMRRLRQSPCIRWLWVAIFVEIVFCMPFQAHGKEVSEQAGKTMGLVLGYWNMALYQTEDGKEECPEGFHHTQGDNFRAQFPTDSQRLAMLKKYAYYTNRGPQGENVFYHPTLIVDPLPFRPVHGKTGLGINLDNKISDDDFTSPEGETGIDNQLYRVVGCLPGWRKGGMVEGIVLSEIRASNKPRVLLEITGIDDEENDSSVTVMIYRGLDPVEAGPDGKLIPFRSQRIDRVEGKRFIQQLQGSISDGVLRTTPLDIRLPSYEQSNMPGEYLIKDAQIQLQLNETGAVGYVGGAFDIEHWYLMFAKTWGAHFIADVIGWSGPATYAALYEYSDGHPDQNGKNTTISGAYKAVFSRVFIIHGDDK